MAGTRVLVRVRGDGRAFAASAVNRFGAAATTVEPILSLPAAAPGFGLAGADPLTWLRVSTPAITSDNPWDQAHAMLSPGAGFAAAGQGIDLVEPDIDQAWPNTEPDRGGTAPPAGPGLAAADRCVFNQQDPSGGKAIRKGEFAWNLGDAFSQLATARGSLGQALERQLSQIVIAHLDTGYDPHHITLPLNIDLPLARNFVDGPAFLNDAADRVPPGESLFTNRGHGTATLALLAGGNLDGTLPGTNGFRGVIGGAPFARVIPVRIADWVVRFSTGTMVQGIDHAVRSGAHVLSMSMGGLTSAALVDAINLAYDRGLVVVTAAGNNFAGSLIPTSIVFPARYARVIAATGVMADGRAYAGLASGTMQGNYGPASKMATALGAFTPNVPWALIDCPNIVGMDGAGTSSATPQVAAAVALWLAQHAAGLAAYSEPWMRVEAVRRALFQSAAKSTAVLSTTETLEKIGQGVMKAADALKIAPATASDLVKLPPSQSSWGWLDLITGSGVRLAPGTADPRQAMLALELTQMAQISGVVDAALRETEPAVGVISAVALRRYLEAALDAGRPSQALKALLERSLGRSQSTVAVPAVAPPVVPTPVERVRKQPPPPKRRLRVYALDPSIAKSLESVEVNETTLEVTWEEDLKPGPVGEYIEVVDVDPASNRFYEPVDLNQPKLLAQDGWPPSEGNPQFHQQMVYAVAMTTIQHFEAALGRKALWAAHRGPIKDRDGGERFETYEVPRLRIYPHALRTENAYYSPDKVALLLGYFPARSGVGDVTPPGSMVFGCLSSDIIHHEMSHALLDGLHRRFQEASNPDVPAFHEAFADIVALFQHFAIPELVRFQIAQARGRLDAARLLGGLAEQFGEGTQHGGALRDYLSPDIEKLDYAKTAEMHDRGSILVSTIFSAFIKIVDRRTADLVRLATNGTGILPQGALHPDLVNRLTEETCKVARHVLRMCIRALDYCPAVDITFGEYLRALITADKDLIADDRYYYRVAFMESFRNRGLLPRDVRTVSEETLAWGTLEKTKPEWLDRILAGLDLNWDMAEDRATIYRRSEKNRWKVWSALKAEFARDPGLCSKFGLNPGVPRYDSKGEIAKAVKANETTFDILGIRPSRRVAPDGTFRTEVIATIQQRRPERVDPDNPAAGWFWFRGGTTLILDAREGHHEVRYSIVKSSSSVSRLQRQRQMVQGHALSPLRALYFGGMSGEPFAQIHSDRGELDHD